ncbi:MAG TPA: hypothetical protein VGO86_03180 [Candidatus Dormibacteraeota bacterium]|jgi:hypothetical protein
MQRFIAALVVAVAATFTAVGGVQPVLAAGDRTAEAEIFATNNTAIITDPNDPRLRTGLRAFERQVDGIVHRGGSEVESSTLLNGVFWDSARQQVTYERSREFSVEDIDAAQLHADAAVIRDRFHQESVLTFEPLPQTSPRAQAVQVEVPGVDVRRLHDGLVANPALRDALGGGSVTLGGRLILVASRTDLGLVQRFVGALGGDLAAGRVQFGAEEFV